VLALHLLLHTVYGLCQLCRAAGESWGHAACTRVILYWQDGERYAHVYKSPSLPAATARFLVTTDGVRGPKPPKRGADGQAPRGAPGADTAPPAQRQRT
jgi:hypothetical protein